MSISEEEFEQQQKCIFQKRGSAYWGFHFMVDICFSLKRFLSAWRGVFIFPSIPLHLLEWRHWDLGILERFHALTCFSISFLYYKDEYVSLAFCKIIQTLRTDSLTPKRPKSLQCVNHSIAKLLRETIFGSYKLCHFDGFWSTKLPLNIKMLKSMRSKIEDKL